MEAYEEKSAGMPNNCTLAEYRKKYAPEHLRKNVQTLAMVGYLLSAANLGMAIWNGNWIQMALAVVLLAMNVGLHLNKSKACAIGILVLACAQLLLAGYLGSSPANWGWIALGVCCVNPIKEMDRAFAKEIRRRNREY
jgi:hypothetical protein